MKGKWHINSKGVPSLCKAEKRPCPLGQHFDTEQEAQKVVEKEMEESYGLLPNQDEQLVIERKNKAELIQRITGIKSKGFGYECFASVSVAEEMGLNNVAITDKNGLTINLNIGNEPGTTLNADVFVDRSIEGLSNYYKNIGLPIKDETLLARVVYYSDDVDKGILVQSGGPNVLDAAIIKADEVVDIIEVKELENGAQLPSTTVNVNADGTMDIDTIKKQAPNIQKALKNVNIIDFEGSNLTLDFGDEKSNREMPLYHFLHEYKKKGATSFIYTTNNGANINKIDLTGPEDKVVEELLNKDIEANIVLRANLQTQKAKESDIDRFNNITCVNHFKSEKKSKNKTFKLSDIKEDSIKKSGKYVKVGGFIIPIEYETYKENLDKRIKKEDLRAFKFSLTGNIKTNY